MENSQHSLENLFFLFTSVFDSPENFFLLFMANFFLFMHFFATHLKDVDPLSLLIALKIRQKNLSMGKEGRKVFGSN